MSEPNPAIELLKSANDVNLRLAKLVISAAIETHRLTGYSHRKPQVGDFVVCQSYDRVLDADSSENPLDYFGVLVQPGNAAGDGWVIRTVDGREIKWDDARFYRVPAGHYWKELWPIAEADSAETRS